MATADGEFHSYHYDYTGNTMALADEGGNIVNRYAYDPFGFNTTSAEGIAQPFTYVGRYGVMKDPTGFYYMRARFYDPQVSRFISEDPLGFSGGDLNLYAYVVNNPITRVDPSGLYWFRQSWQTPGVVGRDGTPVKPGGSVSEFVEQSVPAGYTFGEMHDAFVGSAKNVGFPDWLVNVPSMVPMYIMAVGKEVLRSLGILDQPTPANHSSPAAQTTNSSQPKPATKSKGI